MPFKRIASFIRTKGLQKPTRSIGNKRPVPTTPEERVPPIQQPNFNPQALGVDVSDVKHTLEKPAPSKKSSRPQMGRRHI